MHIHILFHFIGFFAITLAFNVPQEWIIGLRTGHSSEEHLALVGQYIDIKQHIPEINGYAIPTSEDDEQLLSSIRQDHQVGFIVQKPRGFFPKAAHIGLSGYDLDEYEDERRWLTLQDQDLEVIVTDEGAIKIPFTWRIFFTDKAAKEEHLETVGLSLHTTYVLSRSYSVMFDDQIQEKEYLSLIKDDPSVTAVYPERERHGIFYDEVEGTHPEPDTSDDVVIHEVGVRSQRICTLDHNHLTADRNLDRHRKRRITTSRKNDHNS
ncbi:hypothetical protein E4T52_13105 [Aureobasidium sp. EXF-3400]|nr:hypothetical protein E4T51_12070 [Aureobasidium sp. EXF-12344]KAI4771908.1 hypothetical protein E4T52_13105 [Aureobasidium sp. EXF-3400]